MRKTSAGKLVLLATLAAATFLVPSAGVSAQPADVTSGTRLHFSPLKHNNPALEVGLGVGLWGWPVPCDKNADGLPDLVVSCRGLPSHGVYYFENTGRRDAERNIDIFKPAVRLSDGSNDITPSYTTAGLRVMGPGAEYPDFLNSGIEKPKRNGVNPREVHHAKGTIRGQQYSYVDYDADGVLDMIGGVGDWTDYGWDNAYDENGRWTNGPLHGFVYLIRNSGTNENPKYEKPVRLQADGRDIDLYGTPSPVFADFRSTGVIDLICGEFVDGLTFFENAGTREKPRYAPGRRLRVNGEPLKMPLCMIVVTAYDWTRDGKPDLVVAQEDGRVALMENTGRIVDGMPEFSAPRFFRQEADTVKFGVLSAPVAVDWDGDGNEDLLSGNAAGEIAFIRNEGGTPPRWAEPRLLEADGEPIRIMAGYNGSIQGPAESKWGYTNIDVGDWDGDGLSDVLANSIWGKIIWFKNIGSRTTPELAAAQPVTVDWGGGAPAKPEWNWWDPQDGELVVQWRSTPYVMDVDKDGINDLVSIDHEGYLAFYRQVERGGKRVVLPGERIFRMRGDSSFDMIQKPTGEKDGLLRLSSGYAGKSGRRTYCFTDWDADGKLDLLVNSVNCNFLRNVSEMAGEWVFEDMGPVAERKLAGHSTAPTMLDWDNDGTQELLLGAEDGRFYLLER